VSPPIGVREGEKKTFGYARRVFRGCDFGRGFDSRRLHHFRAAYGGAINLMTAGSPPFGLRRPPPPPFCFALGDFFPPIADVTSSRTPE